MEGTGSVSPQKYEKKPSLPKRNRTKHLGTAHPPPRAPLPYWSFSTVYAQFLSVYYIGTIGKI